MFTLRSDRVPAAGIKTCLSASVAVHDVIAVGPAEKGVLYSVVEVFMEFEAESSDDSACRARFRYNSADANEDEDPVRTAVIIIEASYEDAMRKAKAFPDQQLSALLRSILPEPG